MSVTASSSDESLRAILVHLHEGERQRSAPGPLREIVAGTKPHELFDDVSVRDTRGSDLGDEPLAKLRGRKTAGRAHDEVRELPARDPPKVPASRVAVGSRYLLDGRARHEGAP